MPTKIPWADETINPYGWGCYGPEGTPEHPRPCPYCYARVFAARGVRDCPDCRSFRPHWHPEQFDKLDHWQKPRKVFVQSMGDPFGNGVGLDKIDYLVSKLTCGAYARHVRILLTKCPGRMQQVMNSWVRFWAGGAEERLRGLWLGVTVEHQAAADERIPLLLQTPAAIRFLSIEPIQAAIDLSPWIPVAELPHTYPGDTKPATTKLVVRPLRWVIIGSDSRPGAKLPDPAWVETIIEQCRAAGVALWIKGALKERWPIEEYPRA